MTRFLDDRAPLEYTKASTIQIIVVCPHCKVGQSVGKNWYAGECVGCKKVFNKNNSLSEDEMKKIVSGRCEIVSPEYLKMRTDMHSKAETYKTNVLDKQSNGVLLSHEPDGRNRS